MSIPKTLSKSLLVFVLLQQAHSFSKNGKKNEKEESTSLQPLQTALKLTKSTTSHWTSTVKVLEQMKSKTETTPIWIKDFEGSMATEAAPTVATTHSPVGIQATGFVSQYSYATSSCSGVPNSVTSYSLGVCFACNTNAGYCSYSLGSSNQSIIHLSLNSYYDNICASYQQSSSYTLVTACSNGNSYNYSSAVPVVPASVSTSYYPDLTTQLDDYTTSSSCSTGASFAFITVYQTVGNCNPTTNQIYMCSGGPDYKVVTFNSPSCTGTITSSTTHSLKYCSYQKSTFVPMYTNEEYGFNYYMTVYVTTQYSSGPTAPPTLAPIGPTQQPTSTLRPTPASTRSPTVTRTRYFVSQYIYDTSTCSGVPSSIIVYQLGVCFSLNNYNGMYTKGTSLAGTITLIFSQYPYSSSTTCSGSPKYSTSYNLATSCSNGNNFTYTTTAPIVPQSVATSYYSYTASCTSVKPIIFVTVYQTVGNCNPTMNQVYNCAASNFNIQSFSDAGCSGAISTTQYALTSCAYFQMCSFDDDEENDDDDNVSNFPEYILLGSVTENSCVKGYTKSQCVAGPTAPPTTAPSAPTSKPTAGPTNPSFKPTAAPTWTPTTANPTFAPTTAPTSNPTSVPQATGFISQFTYSTPTCSGVPTSVSSYSLGICFSTSSSYPGSYAQISLSSASSDYVTVVYTTYSDNLCTIFQSSDPYQLSATCGSNGFFYDFSTSAPAVPASVALSYYSAPAFCGLGVSSAFYTLYQTIGSCNPSENQIYACSGSSSSQYYIQNYQGVGCSGTSYSSSYAYSTCSYAAATVVFDYLSNFDYGFYGENSSPAYGFLTSRCFNGPTATPTMAPSGPTPIPTALPTQPPTPVAQSTGFVSKYTYTSSTCAGAPNSVSVYSLGICFYDSSVGSYAAYSLGSKSLGLIPFVVTSYNDDLCTSLKSSQVYNLATICSGGSNFTYSSAIPTASQSVATSYYSQASLCGLGTSSALVTVYQMVGTCNPSSNQIYTCSGSSYSVNTFTASGCAGSSSISSYTSASSCSLQLTTIPSFVPFTSTAYVTSQCISQPSTVSSSSSSSSSNTSGAALGLAVTSFIILILLILVIVVGLFVFRGKIQSMLQSPEQQSATNNTSVNPMSGRGTVKDVELSTASAIERL